MGFLGKIRKKLCFQRGQHMIEYSILLTLVMAGIITMSRYVIRSWNANLKGWEDSVIDSQEDPLQSTTYTLSACPIPDWVNVGCGLEPTDPAFSLCGEGSLSCPPVKMLQTRTFSPAGCNCALSPSQEAVQCVFNSCCCTPPQGTGKCGTDASAPGPDPLCNDNGTTTPSNRMIPKNPDGSCPAGYEEAYTTCGSKGPVLGCFRSSKCSTICQDPPFIEPTAPYSAGGYCPGDSPPASGSVPNIFIDPDISNCTPGRDCEYRCSPGYFAINGEACGPCTNPGIEKFNQTTGRACPAAADGLPTFWFGTGCPAGKWKPCCNN